MGYDAPTWDVNVDDAAVELFEKYNAPRPHQLFSPPNPNEFKELKESPKYGNDLELFPYKLKDLNGLVGGWCNGKNCILADEMGLGKTVQAVAFLDYVHRIYGLP